MATSSRNTAIPRIWNDPEQVLKEWPSNISPRRLKLFCDTMVHSFLYDGDFFPAAVFRCDNKLTAWGLQWIESADDKVVICPKMMYMERGHPTTGLSVLELQGLDNSTGLIVVQETIPKSEESIRYGLILDYSKMDMDFCESITKKGMLSNLNDSHLWTPTEIKDEWDIIDEQRQEKNGPIPIAQVSPAKPAVKSKGKKRKSIVGAPGDEEPAEETEKKKRKTNTPALTIQRAVNMTDVDINKLSPEEMKSIHKLYQDTFTPLYKWSKKPLEHAEGKPLRVHYKYLHQAPPGKLVYRGIQQDRLKKIKNRILVDGDYTSENRYITVLPLKIGPYGPDNKVKYWDACPKKENLTTTSHYYIIGGQHTVEATRLLVEKGDIPARDKAWASTFNIIPIWRVYDPKNNDICHLSRALNQNIADEQREQNFTKQLLHCRIKWKEVGSPMPSLHGRGHSAEYTAFYPLVSTIFTGVKGTDAADLKIPLLFMENDDDIDRWIKIEEKFLKYELPDGGGDSSKAKRKPFAKNDFKPLYGMRTEDINFLVGLVESGDVCMKNVKPGASFYGRTVISLSTAGALERQIRVMKNELMFHYRQHPLPSKQPDYVPYSAAEWDEFADEKKITRNDLELWMDKSLATELGMEWLRGRTQGLNKTTDPNDCPEAVKSMWQTFMGVHAEEAAEAAAVQSFEMQYCCYVMDESTWDISSILADNDVKSWRGVGKTHVYFWFLFELTRVGAQAKVLDNTRLKRLFDALEYRDSTSHVQRARSPVVLITDAQGFHTILCHLQKRFEQTRFRVWDWHVVNYIPDGCDGFPRPTAGSHSNVFIVSLFEHDVENGSTAAFHAFFSGLQDLKAVYKSDEMEDLETCYRRRPKPWFKITSALNIFGPLTFKDMVLVNVNGAAEFTFLGIWAGWKVIEVVASEEARGGASTTARQIWDQFNLRRPDSEDEGEEEERADGQENDDEDILDDNAGRTVQSGDEDKEEGNADKAVEIEDDEVDGHHDDTEVMESWKDDGRAPGNEEGDDNVDSEATQDDVPLNKSVPPSDDRFRVVPAVPSVKSNRGGRRKRSSKAAPSSRKLEPRRERRSKRSLDFPFNDFGTQQSPDAQKDRHSDDNAEENQISDDDIQVISSAIFALSTVPLAQISPPSIKAICPRVPKDVAGRVEVVVNEHGSSKVPSDDPYSLSSVADITGVEEKVGKTSGDLPMTPSRDLPSDVSGFSKNPELSECLGNDARSSGDLQMPSSPVKDVCHDVSVSPSHLESSQCLGDDVRSPGDLQMPPSPCKDPCRNVSVLPSNAEASECPADDARSSGDLPMSSENVTNKPEDEENLLDLPVDTTNSAMLGNESISAAEGSTQADAAIVTGEKVVSPLRSYGTVTEVPLSNASGDLLLPSDLVTASAVDMPENIMQDTLSDLNPMSPEAESSKVNPFKAVPFPGYTTAQVLENREINKMFLECPGYMYNKKGKITKASMEARSVWRANMFLYRSLFELPVARDTQAQEEEEMLATELEEAKGA